MLPPFAVVIAFRSNSSPGLDDNQPHRRPAEGGRPPTPLRRRAPHAPRPRGHQQQGQQQVGQRLQKRRVGFGRGVYIEFIVIRPGVLKKLLSLKSKPFICNIGKVITLNKSGGNCPVFFFLGTLVLHRTDVTCEVESKLLLKIGRF